MSEYSRDLSLEGPMVPHDYGFEMAFGLATEIDPSYGYYTVNNIRNYVSNQSDDRGLFRSKDYLSINLTNCSDRFFQAFN